MKKKILAGNFWDPKNNLMSPNHRFLVLPNSYIRLPTLSPITSYFADTSTKTHDAHQLSPARSHL